MSRIGKTNGTIDAVKSLPLSCLSFFELETILIDCPECFANSLATKHNSDLL